MASLTNTKIKDTYDGLLKTTDNDALGGTYKLITDGLGNSSGVYLGTGGKVGIGTSSPSYPLDVNGEIRTSSRLWISTVDAISLTGSDLRFGYSNSNLLFRTNSSERLRIDSSGNVGIGTSSPLSKLHITNNSGGSGGYLKVTDAVYGGDVRFGMADGVDNDAVLGVWTNNNVKIYTNSTERMRIDSSGNFGFNATPENSSGTWRNYQLGSLSMAGRNNDSNPDAMFGTNFKFTTANAEQRISAHATSRLFFNDDVITFQNAASGAADSAISWSERMVIDSSGRLGLGLMPYTTSSLLNLKGDGLALKNDENGGSNNWSLIQNLATGTYSSIDFTTGQGLAMTIDHSKNVGIGTSSPALSSKLNVESTTTSLDSGGTVFATVTDAIAANIGGQVMMGGYYTGTTTCAFGGFAAKKENATDGNYAGYLQFLTSSYPAGNTEKMRIDSIGNVGIGTSSPSAKLEISSVQPRIMLKDTTTGVSSGYTTSAIDFYTSDTSSEGSAVNAKIESYASDIYGRLGLRFFTGGGGAPTQAMTIDSSGNVLVGTDSSAGGGKLTVDVGAISGTLVSFQNSQNLGGSISIVSGGGTSFNTSSDYRLKENVVDMTGALDRVDQLEPKRFNFIADEDTTVDGFLAHEVQEVIPEAVTGEKDAVDEEGNDIYQGIDQSKLVPLLVGAIKELRAEVNSLKAQINN